MNFRFPIPFCFTSLRTEKVGRPLWEPRIIYDQQPNPVHYSQPFHKAQHAFGWKAETRRRMEWNPRGCRGRLPTTSPTTPTKKICKYFCWHILLIYVGCGGKRTAWCLGPARHSVCILTWPKQLCPSLPLQQTAPLPEPHPRNRWFLGVHLFLDMRRSHPVDAFCNFRRTSERIPPLKIVERSGNIPIPVGLETAY